MNRILFFIFVIGITSKAFGQIEFNTKFKTIPPLNVKVKPKKEILPKTDLQKFNLPKIVAPNVFKETNIFGIKTKPDNSFEIGIPENHFSLAPKNNFAHKLGDVYQAQMSKDLDKTLVKEGLKEDKSVLDRTDRYLGEYRTKSEFFAVKYRDYGLIDGDLINVYLNGKILRSELYLNAEFGEFRIPLALGFNDIEFVVASTGTVGGNTAEMHVLDDVNREITSEYWDNLALGVKIKMIVIRE